MDIARGDICRARKQDRFEKISKIFSLCHSGGSQLEDFPEGNLLKFALPFGNGRKVETIDIVSPINPRFPATINSPKNVIKIDDFNRAFFVVFITIRQAPGHYDLQ